MLLVIENTVHAITVFLSSLTSLQKKLSPSWKLVLYSYFSSRPLRVFCSPFIPPSALLSLTARVTSRLAERKATSSEPMKRSPHASTAARRLRTVSAWLVGVVVEEVERSFVMGLKGRMGNRIHTMKIEGP